jgi:hypothetical protein
MANKVPRGQELPTSYDLFLLHDRQPRKPVPELFDLNPDP